MSDSVLTISKVKKKLKKQVIIENLNLKAAQGEIIALLGGNGAGKSTILKMAAGIWQPDAGHILVKNVSWRKNRKQYASLIGYMPDNFHFSPGLTAIETMSFWSSLKGLPAQRARVVLEQVGLSDTGTKSVSSFSKGMRQRMMLAQALLANPPIVLMDEPTNGLDPYWVDTFVNIVKQTAKNGQTVIFSTHQLTVAEALSDRILFLRNGQIELDGNARQIRDQLGSSHGLQDALSGWFG
ncbi:ABC transporter ATP-binding protein [Paenibacillus sp. YAF4_2]|uniref:ABC transporter ATP-binding protein n=1 Tax=Paenibacillus sp. YAF4_2 TaxID=3233085 RepID=UPI003F9AAF77